MKQKRTGGSASFPVFVRSFTPRYHSFVRLGLLAVLLVSFAPYAFSQAQPPVVGQNSGGTRSIVGAVISESGSGIQGAVVLLKDTKTLQVRSYIAQASGKYHFYGLSTDVNYQLRAEANGLTSKVKTVSVFDSHKVVNLDLKVYKKLKSQ